MKLLALVAVLMLCGCAGKNGESVTSKDNAHAVLDAFGLSTQTNNETNHP